jgi:hypothetical protein
MGGARRRLGELAEHGADAGVPVERLGHALGRDRVAPFRLQRDDLHAVGASDGAPALPKEPATSASIEPPGESTLTSALSPRCPST